MSDLPEFDNPPVVEVVLGVQFRPLFAMRGLALAPLRERWRREYPQLEEQPPLAPAAEGSPPLLPQLALSVVQVPAMRQWFLSEDGTRLIQLQPDRFLINWRAMDGTSTYPRYPHMRETFAARFGDLDQFVTEQKIGELEITQVELTYINAIDVDRDELGLIGRFLKGWSGAVGHHLGEPEQSRVILTFLIPGIGHPPVRLYAEVNPALRPTSGDPVLFFTLTVRGSPGGKNVAEAIKFLDEAHDHLVQSFAELTEKSMHEAWGRRQ